MNNINSVCDELLKIGKSALDSKYNIGNICRLALENLETVKYNFQNQPDGRALVNALNLISASCSDASGEMSRVCSSSMDIVRMLER